MQKEIKEISKEDLLPEEFIEDLTLRQRTFIMKLLETGDIKKTSAILHISRSSWYTWSKEEGFMNVVNLIHAKLMRDTITEMSLLLPECVKVYEELIHSRNEHTRLKAVNSLVDRINRLKSTSDLEMRITALEKIIKLNY